MRFSILLLLVVLFAATPVFAQVKDSYYFMSDGEQTKEEMEEEAQYVYSECNSNMYRRQWFDCACIAGAFLQERERRGSLPPQDVIVDALFRGTRTEMNRKNCANAPAIAGDAHANCMSYAGTFREYERDNEEYCACVANTIARDFARTPYLRSRYTEELSTRAYLICDQRDENGNPVRGQR